MCSVSPDRFSFPLIGPPFSSCRRLYFLRVICLPCLDQRKKRQTPTSKACDKVFSVCLHPKKKDGGLRPCIDYHPPNDITVKWSEPLPLIPSSFEKLCDAVIFTKVDLQHIYNLIQITEGNEWKTSFINHTGQYAYSVMPYRLANSPSIFQTFMKYAQMKYFTSHPLSNIFTLSEKSCCGCRITAYL